MENKDLAKYLEGFSTETLDRIARYIEEELKKRQVRGFEVAKGFEKEVKYLPSRATPFSGGYDFYPLEEIKLQPGASYSFYTGVKAYMPGDEVLIINIRSSYGIKYGIELCNEQGWIDSDYYSNKDNDGVIIVKVKNSGNKSFSFNKEEPFAQGMFISYRIADNDRPRLTCREGGIGHSS